MGSSHAHDAPPLVPARHARRFRSDPGIGQDSGSRFDLGLGVSTEREPLALPNTGSAERRLCRTPALPNAGLADPGAVRNRGGTTAAADGPRST